MIDEDMLKTRVASVMVDPSAQAIAHVYSTAFLDAAESGDVVDALEELASLLDDVLSPHPEFESLLLSGIVGRDEKIGLIDRVVVPFASPLLTSFLKTLARHDRLDLLPLILQQSRQLYDERSGRKRIRVISPDMLTDQSLETIRERLDSCFPFEPVIEAETDPSLLGGLVIRVDDTVYDSSLKTRLKQLRTQLSERSLYEIQSGRDRFSHPEGD